MENQTPSTRQSMQWLIVIPILLLVFWLGLSRMLTDALWLDEILTHIYSGTGGLESQSIFDILYETATNDRAWPPLYYLFNYAWSQFSGNSLLSGHLLSAYFGLLAVALTYRFGKELIGSTGGLFAALLVGTSGLFVYFLHETRAYTMYIFFVLLSGWIYWQIITRPNYKVRWLRWGFPFAIAAALYTHYVSSAFVAAILVYHLLIERPRTFSQDSEKTERWFSIIKLWLNGCLIFSAWVAILVVHFLIESDNLRATSPLILLEASLVTFTNNTWIVSIFVLFLSLFLVRKRSIQFIWVWFVSSIVFIIIMNSLASFLFHPRHFLALLPIAALLLAASLVEIYKRAKIIAIALIAIWVGAGIYYTFQDDFLYIIPKQYEILPMSLVNNAEAFTEQCVAPDDTIIFNIMPYETEYQYETSFYLYYFREEVVDFNIEYLGTLTSDYQFFSTLLLEIIALPYNERIDVVTADSEQVWVLSHDELYTTEEFIFASNTLRNSGYMDCASLAVGDNLRADLFTRGDSCEVVLNTCDFGE